jgi:hypothetical protein
MKTAIGKKPESRFSSLAEQYRSVRSFSETLCETLEPEDCCVQSMPDASPIRWHLAHITWFFETFVLAKTPAYEPHRGEYAYLFNSYYNAVGEQFPRERRGLLSRPTVAQVWEYRREIDRHMMGLMVNGRFDPTDALAPVIELGLHHEQQHQELMLTDIKHALFTNPLTAGHVKTEPLLKILPRTLVQIAESISRTLPSPLKRKALVQMGVRFRKSFNP